MNSPARRITACWWAPWFRTLARNYIATTQNSHTRWWILTSNNHIDSSQPILDWEICVKASRSLLSKPRHLVQTLLAFYRMRPDVVFADEPARGYQALLMYFVAVWRPTVVVIHDAQPQDPTQALGWFAKYCRRLLFRKVRIFLAMSPYTESLLRNSGMTRTRCIPLLPEAPDYEALVPAHRRKNFAMIGRWSEYKGFDLGISAYGAYRHICENPEDLDLWLSGAPEMDPLPPGVVCRSTNGFTWNKLLDQLVTYRAVLLPYRNASQSGVQVLAWAAGVPTLVADIPGLTQLQPECCPAISTSDLELWARRMLDLMSDEHVVSLGALGKEAILRSRGRADIAQVLETAVQDCLNVVGPIDTASLPE